MSLLTKFTKMFKSKDELLESLALLLKPKSQKDFDVACEHFGTLMKKYPAVVFNFLRSKENVESYHPKAEHLLNILFVIHANIVDESVSAQIRGPPIYWLDKLMLENKESFILIERMICEASTSSFFPQQSPLSLPSQYQGKNEQVKEKRKNRQEMNEQLKNPTLTQENLLNSAQIKPKLFCIIYYSYLQKLSVNLLVYQSSKDMEYPFEEPEDVKLRFIWIYKIQNIMLMGLKLLECRNPKYKIHQDLVFNDLQRFQVFIRQEIEQLIDHYATIPNLDCLSLFEIFSEFQRARTIMESYNPDFDLKLRVSSRQIEEFLSFSVRIKVLNQFAFKKSIKVPNRMQPNMSVTQSSEKKHQKAASELNKENFEPLNMVDLQHDHMYERGVIEKKFYNQSTENSFEDEQILQPRHIKGLSTFQQH